MNGFVAPAVQRYLVTHGDVVRNAVGIAVACVVVLLLLSRDIQVASVEAERQGEVRRAMRVALLPLLSLLGVILFERFRLGV